MSFQYDQEKEEAICAARERVGEAVDVLEEMLPDTAEELSWIRDQLSQELFRLQHSISVSADEKGDLF